MLQLCKKYALMFHHHLGFGDVLSDSNDARNVAIIVQREDPFSACMSRLRSGFRIGRPGMLGLAPEFCVLKRCSLTSDLTGRLIKVQDCRLCKMEMLFRSRQLELALWVRDGVAR